MMAATCLPLPQPVPSPSIQPRRKRTGSDRVSPSWVTREVSTSSSFPSSSSLRRWTVSHWEPMRYSADRCREWAPPARYDALELGVRQQAVGDDALGQQGAVCRQGMRHGGHGGGLHQRRRMLDRARHPHGARPPRRVGAGVVGRGIGIGIGGGFDRAGLDNQFGDRPPVMGPPRLGRGYGLGTPARCRLRRDRLAEQVAGGTGRDRRGRDRLPSSAPAR